MVTWSMRMVSSPSEQSINWIEFGGHVGRRIRALHVPTTSGAQNGVHSGSYGYSAGGRKGQSPRARRCVEPDTVGQGLQSYRRSSGAFALPVLQRGRAKLALFWDWTANWLRNGVGPWGLRRHKQRALATTFIFGSSPTSSLADSLPASGSD